MSAEAQTGETHVVPDYDHFAPKYVDEPFAFWKEMRDNAPVFKSEVYEGFKVIMRYADVLEASQRPDLFSSKDGPGHPRIPLAGMVPIDYDPPEHREYRQIINPALTVNAVRKHEPRIREIVVGLIEPLEELDEFDAAQALAVPLPPKSTLSFIGFPEEVHDRVAKASDEVARLRGQDAEKLAAAAQIMLAESIALVERRRQEPPKDDLISLMMAGTFFGRPIEDWEIVQCLGVLLFGAVDTTANAVAGSLWYLAMHQDDQEKFRDVGDIPNLWIEEMLRWVSPIQANARTCVKDTELSGCPIKAGERVLLMWGSGNRDERQFANPEEVELERQPNKHMALGMGPHRCVGVHMGKLMLKIALEELLARIGPFELADPAGVKWVGGESRGIRALPLRKR